MKTSEKTPKTIHFPVVGIGASAGGLDAFKKLLKEISPDSGMAYVIVQHLSPDYDSNLTEILTQFAAIPVHEIINDIDLKPNNIYIIPEDNNVIANDGVLKLERRSRNEKKNTAINIFFESLAEVHQSFAIGIVLSGTAYDGTLGLKKIKELGGATIAQDPESAAFKAMPQSAIDADAVDYVLPPESIPAQLLLIRDIYASNHAYSEEEHIPKNEEETLQQILNLILLRTGNDFRHYKQPTIRRRIARRMVIMKAETLRDYFHHLRNDRAEQDLLFNDFLIPVTYFFRDHTFYESLPKTIFPQLLQNAVNKNLRIWVAGCATGEEAYSLAIILHEYLYDNNIKDIKVQIFASDISEKCVTKARSAIYSPQDIQKIRDTRLHKYFTKRDGHYHINKVIRDMCVFAVHNFIKDPPFAKIALVSCRNVLIYMDSYLQNKVLSSFHYSLKENGVLLLGKSETAAAVPNLFDPVSKNDKIYVRKFAPGRYIPEAFNPPHINIREKIEQIEKKGATETDFRKIASDILFSRYTPVGTIINDHQEIVHFHGDTSAFLLPSPGKPNFNILKMAREGISFELRNALLIAKKEKRIIARENITVKDQPYLASFEIVPLDTDDNHIMVLFYKKEIPIADTDASQKENIPELKRIKELEQELLQLRQDIKRVTEEQQTAFEELQTTNEELLSSSEELQALNEELETSTEELQSNNEELMCVNDELLDRQDQLISLHNYSESIVKTIREPLLVVDKDFMIRSANHSFYKYFNTKEEETESKNLFEIGDCQWNIPEFREVLQEMLQGKTTIEDFRVNIFCPGIGKKVLLVNGRHVVDAKPGALILLALEDITDLVNTNELLLRKNNALELYNEQLENFTSSASHDLQEPLRKIHMFSQRIRSSEKSLSPESQHDLERIKFASNHMSQLIKDLISYSRISMTEKGYKKTDMNLLLKKTIDVLKESITERNAVVTALPLPELRVIPHQIQQLFTNLILNSIKYTEEGKAPQITIRSEKATEEEISSVGGNTEIRYAKIMVTDNGIGFGTEYQEKIFNPFYRLHSNDRYQGSGLGLTLAKKIVANHLGFIRASGKINEGTTIFIYLMLD